MRPTGADKKNNKTTYLYQSFLSLKRIKKKGRYGDQREQDNAEKTNGNGSIFGFVKK